MNEFKNYILKNWFLLLTILIVAVSAFLRFYNYGNRWGLAYDQAYGAIIGRYALQEGKIPLVGPFSSAGPFQTGGEWYWFIMLGTIFPDTVNSPWIFLTLTSIIFVLLMIFLGKELVNKEFGIFVGAMAAFSTSQIAQSLNLTNQSVVSLFSLLAIWASIKYIRLRKLKYIFLLGLTVSISATIHLQGAALLFLILTTLLFAGMPRIKEIGSLFLGLFIPTIPILIFDLKNDFVNTRNMIQYYLYDQYKISLDVLGRRWITYLSSFWPTGFAHIIGGNSILSIFIMAGLTISIFFSLLKKKLSKEWVVIAASFLLMIIFLRYLRTPLFDSYLIFLHPFIFLLTGWLIFFLFKKSIFLRILLLVIILTGSLIKDLPELKVLGNYSALEAQESLKILTEKFPDEKFSIYSYKYKWADKNLILSLYLYTEDKIADNGRRIGIIVPTEEANFKYPIIQDKFGYHLVDLQSSSSSVLAAAQWINVNPKQVYESTEDWYKKDE